MKKKITLLLKTILNVPIFKGGILWGRSRVGLDRLFIKIKSNQMYVSLKEEYGGKGIHG